MEHLANFTVSNNAKIFNLLSKNLYSDPLTASLREAGTNAIDATRENNIDPQLYPIELKIYSDWACRDLVVVSFTDRGIGISPDRMNDFVANLGASSKTADNNQNGKFGIGMLAIFSLSDQFTIDTVISIENVLYQHQYIVFIGEAGIPTYTQVLSRPSEEAATRTTISFPAPNIHREDVLFTCKNVWDTSELVHISEGEKFLPRPTRHTVFASSGYKLVGNNPEFLNCVHFPAIVVQIGDVTYPFFTESSELQSRTFRDYLFFQQYDRFKKLVPKDAHEDLERGYAHLFTRNGEALLNTAVTKRLKCWRQGDSQASLLYLQFAKDELSLPASRENIADNAENARAIADRLAMAIVGLARQVPVSFETHLAQGDIAESFNLARHLYRSFQISMTISDLKFDWNFLLSGKTVVSTIDWDDEWYPQSGNAKNTSTLDWFWIAKYILSTPVGKIRLLAISRGSEPEIKSIAQLERTIGTKINKFGDFICLSFPSQDKAIAFTQMSQLGNLGYVWEFYNYAPPEANPKTVKKSRSIKEAIGESQNQVRQKFNVIDSIAIAAKCKGSVDFYDSLRLKLDTVPTDWYLPGRSWYSGDVGYLAILAHRLGISGSVIFTANSDLPVPADFGARNLLVEIELQVEAYLRTIAPQVTKIGFIPGVDYDEMLHPRESVCEWQSLADPCLEIQYVKRQILFTQIEWSGVCSNEVTQQLSFCHTSRYLNRLIFHYYGIFATEATEQFIRQALKDWFKEDRFDDTGFGWETFEIAIKAIEQKFPLIRLCNGMNEFDGLSSDLGVGSSYDLSNSALDLSIDLLTQTIQNI